MFINRFKKWQALILTSVLCIFKMEGREWYVCVREKGREKVGVYLKHLPVVVMFIDRF